MRVRGGPWSPDRQLRTAAWYGDRPLALDFPDDWDVTVAWPDTPPPLSDAQLAAALEQPVRQAPIRELARGKSRPMVIVDDLTRPTPAGRILSLLLRHFEEAGIPRRNVSVLLATGTHGRPPSSALASKTGPEAAAACRLLVHDDQRDLVRVGRTTFGTPVIINREVLASDFLVGVGGVYPQYSAGFGGGSKLALGVLGQRSIADLHYGHPSMDGSYETENDFRRDVDEIARLIGLNTMVSVLVDAQRNIFHARAGDHYTYYPDMVSVAKQAFLAPHPGDTDVVLSNAYPIDISLTFMRSKGIVPLLHAQPGASRVLVAACSEGVGYHGLFPFMHGPRFAAQRHLLRKLSHMAPTAVPGAVSRRMRRARVLPTALRFRPSTTSAPEQRNPIWLYPPGRSPGDLPARIPGVKAVYTWSEVIERICREQAGRRALKVVLYPCAPLQVLDL